MSNSHMNVCHLWASGKKDRATGFNINFTGREIFSYGPHYLLGFRLSAATFLLNSTRYSPSTGKHQSYVSRATHGRTFYVEDLTSYRYALRTIADYANGPGNACDQTGAESAAVGMVRTLAAAPSHDVELFRVLLDFAGVKEAKAARMIDAALRDASVAADKAAKAKAKADKARVMDASKVPFDAVAERVASLVQTLRTAHEYQANQALHSLEATGKQIAQFHRMAGQLGMSDAVKARLWRMVKAYRVAVKEHNAKAESRAALARFTRLADDLRAALARIASGRPSFGTWNAIADRAEQLAANPRVGNPLSTRLNRMSGFAHEWAEWESAEAAKVEAARQADKVARWRAGETVPGFYAPSPYGGAMVRARGVERDDAGAIVGGTLETSQGANVPLVHAVKAFRFVKLVKERGTPWHRNGAQVRVGHYSVDTIHANGSFKAGCHNFAWGEIEQLAVSLEVFDAPASDAVVTHS